jgi:sigma-B regulation protein RsbU (phosphoserine phosphatase)
MDTPIPLLIVDDDPVFALVVKQIVASLGPDLACAPTWVDTAEKGLIELGRDNYDVVLLDYHLPGADGLHVLAQIQQLPAERQPAVIMLTASGNEAVAVEAMKRGARDYLAKADVAVAPLTRAIHNALAQKRLADQVARYSAEMQADLDLARQLQQSLLPQNYPAFPRSASPEQSALRFSHRYLPAAQLGGDFFLVLPLSEMRVGVFICDVMGHGVRAALVTAMVRALAEDLARLAAEPGQFLSEMNRKLCGMLPQTEDPLFATGFYLVADLQAAEMLYANAGHPSALHLQRRRRQAAPLPSAPIEGPAMGMFANAVYGTGRVGLEPNDSVLLFTDGVYEVQNPGADQEYGPERFLNAVRARMDLPPGKLFDGVLAEVLEFSGGAGFIDDVCLLGMEVAPRQT